MEVKRKVCTVCKVQKDTSEFYRKPSNSNGLTAHCKACNNTKSRQWQKENPGRTRKYRQAWAGRNREYMKERKAHARYGVGKEEYKQLMTTPCAVCGSTDRLCIDHCHSTGRVRGTLCRGCNTGIGHLQDSQELLLAAARYIQEHTGVMTK